MIQHLKITIQVDNPNDLLYPGIPGAELNAGALGHQYMYLELWRQLCWHQWLCIRVCERVHHARDPGDRQYDLDKSINRGGGR